MKKIKLLIIASILCSSVSIYGEEFKEIQSFEQQIKTNKEAENSELTRKPIKFEENKENSTNSVKNKNVATIENLSNDNFFQEKPVLTKDDFEGKILDLSKKRTEQGIVYAGTEKTPYTGKFALFLGDFIEYTETYKNGILEGPKTWYSENGNVVLEESYINNKVEGDQKAYYENGNLKSVVNYKRGKINGLVTYSKSGEVLHEDKFKNGNGTWKYFWSNGKVLEEGQYKNWIKDGVWKKYRKTGELDTITEYKDGRLVAVTWN